MKPSIALLLEALATVLSLLLGGCSPYDPVNPVDPTVNIEHWPNVTTLPDEPMPPQLDPEIYTPQTPPVPPQPVVPQPTPVKPRVQYPIRSSWWSGCSNWTHLASGQHRGKFDSAWLASLTNAELQSLHSDDHEGRVKWANVVRPANTPAKAAPVVSNVSSGCPGGNCPVSGGGGRSYSRGFFGRVFGRVFGR